MNSPPLFNLRALMSFHVSLSTSILNLLKIDKAFDFFFKKYTQVYLLKSSIKVTKYFDSKNDRVENGP
jgi:hypothetical protein